MTRMHLVNKASEIETAAQERYDADIKRVIGLYGLSRGAPVPWHMLTADEREPYILNAISSDLAALRVELDAISREIDGYGGQLPPLVGKDLRAFAARIGAVAAKLS